MSQQGPEISIAQYFATPIAQIKVPNCEALNRELAALFIAREQDQLTRNPNRYTTQFGELYESRFDLFSWPDPPVQQLAQLVQFLLTSFVRQVNGYNDAEFAKLTFRYHSWFHITRHGGYQTMHDHAMASWSGIYYIQPGDRLPDRPESGVVRFYDPRGFSPMYIDGGNRRLDSRFSFEPVPVVPEAGKMLFFPSWLGHEILPYQGQTERIMVAFNSWVETRE